MSFFADRLIPGSGHVGFSGGHVIPGSGYSPYYNPVYVSPPIYIDTGWPTYSSPYLIGARFRGKIAAGIVLVILGIALTALAIVGMFLRQPYLTIACFITSGASIAGGITLIALEIIKKKKNGS